MDGGSNLVASKSSPRSLLLWLGVVAPVLRHVMIYGLGAAMPGYSARTDFISEIGALQAPYSLLMNVVGTGLVGLMMILVSLPMSRCLSPMRGGRISAALIGISGVAFLGVAMFPCNPGCDLDPLGMRMALHVAAGTIATGAEVAAPLAFGLGQFRQPRARALGRAALLIGLVGAVADVLFLARAGGLPSGLMQRVIQAAGDTWLFVAALFCIRGSRGPAG